MQLIDSITGNSNVLNQVSFTATGGWQTWETTNTSEVFWLDKGIHHIRILITNQEFNLNWFRFDIVANDGINNSPKKTIDVYPNPANDFITVVSLDGHRIKQVMVFDLYGKLVINNSESVIDLKSLNSGIYFLKVFTANRVEELKIIKN